MDKIEITSSFTNDTWTGMLDFGSAGLDCKTDQQKLEVLFVTFQRDERNALLLDRIGYRLPSLSAGDRVKLNGVAYCCEPVGFKPDWRDPHQPLNPWPIGASDG